jgi:hypothetical protein
MSIPRIDGGFAYNVAENNWFVRRKLLRLQNACLFDQCFISISCTVCNNAVDQYDDSSFPPVRPFQNQTA